MWEVRPESCFLHDVINLSSNCLLLKFSSNSDPINYTLFSMLIYFLNINWTLILFQLEKIRVHSSRRAERWGFQAVSGCGAAFDEGSLTHSHRQHHRGGLPRPRSDTNNSFPTLSRDKLENIFEAKSKSKYTLFFLIFTEAIEYFQWQY